MLYLFLNSRRRALIAELVGGRVGDRRFVEARQRLCGRGGNGRFAIARLARQGQFLAEFRVDQRNLLVEFPLQGPRAPVEVVVGALCHLRDLGPVLVELLLGAQHGGGERVAGGVAGGLRPRRAPERQERALVLLARRAPGTRAGLLGLAYVRPARLRDVEAPLGDRQRGALLSRQQAGHAALVALVGRLAEKRGARLLVRRRHRVLRGVRVRVFCGCAPETVRLSRAAASAATSRWPRPARPRWGRKRSKTHIYLHVKQSQPPTNRTHAPLHCTAPKNDWPVCFG